MISIFIIFWGTHAEAVAAVAVAIPTLIVVLASTSISESQPDMNTTVDATIFNVLDYPNVSEDEIIELMVEAEGLGGHMQTHAWEKDLLATCTTKMAGKVTVGIEDEGKLASTRILEMGLRGEGKIKQEEQSSNVCNPTDDRWIGLDKRSRATPGRPLSCRVLQTPDGSIPVHAPHVLVVELTPLALFNASEPFSMPHCQIGRSPLMQEQK
ncbi:hypothetical protein V6N11_001857 [Hibiscus sabdariffa]|uniref:Uncharacterized protein n=1 Tax=Hibiscus sabdariffa TaxID=183260 RepID=A0ABR2QTW7_9ROSI